MTLQITPYTTVPSRQSPSTFSADRDVRLQEEATRIPQMNAMATEMNENALLAAAQVGLAEDQVALAAGQVDLAENQVALAAAQVALADADVVLTHADVLTTSATANFKGLWSACAGAAAIPYCVSHLGKYWQLAANLANVASKTPGTDADWLIIPTALTWSPITSDPAPAMAGNGYLCNTTAAAFTVTLPAAPTAGDVIAFSDAAGTFDTNNLTIGRAALNIMGLGEDMVVSTKYAAFSLVYASAALGWRISS
jgi:hypothetical protein